MAYLKIYDVLDELAQNGKAFFNLQDAAKIMNKPRNYVSKVLSSNSRVRRIERGKYYIKASRGFDLYEISSQIIFPSYVSLFAALQFHALTEQTVSKFSVISIRRHRPITIEENSIEFRKISKDRFFGYAKHRNSYIATVEKAILDSIYFGTPPLDYIQEAFSTSIRRKTLNVKRFNDYAMKMRSRSLLRICSDMLVANDLSDGKMRKALV